MRPTQLAVAIAALLVALPSALGFFIAAPVVTSGTDRVVQLQWGTDIAPPNAQLRLHYSMLQTNDHSGNQKWNFITQLSASSSASVSAGSTPAAPAHAAAPTGAAAFGSFRWSTIPANVYDQVVFRLTVQSGDDLNEVRSNAIHLPPPASGRAAGGGSEAGRGGLIGGMDGKIWLAVIMFGVMAVGGLIMWVQYERGQCRKRDLRLARQVESGAVIGVKAASPSSAGGAGSSGRPRGGSKDSNDDTQSMSGGNEGVLGLALGREDGAMTTVRSGVGSINSGGAAGSGAATANSGGVLGSLGSMMGRLRAPATTSTGADGFTYSAVATNEDIL